jgi:type IV secretion system protein VirB8
VTAFRVDDEFNAPVFKSANQDAGVPLLNEEEGVTHHGADGAQTGLAPAATALQANLPGAPATPTQGQ